MTSDKGTDMPRTVLNALFLTTTLSLAACATAETPQAELEAWGEIAGFVTDVQGDALIDVTVTVQDLTVLTDDQGYFLVDGVTPSQSIRISYDKPGYARTYGGADLISWETVAASAVMAPIDGTAFFDAVAGGKIQVGEVKVDFPADSIVDKATGQSYSGQVSVEVTHVNPRTDELMAAPGDLRARIKVGDGAAKDLFEESQLVSYGMVDVSLFDVGGDPLQLAQGAGAQVEMPIDQEGLATAYQLVPGDEEKVWSYDPDSVVWVDEGTGTVFEDEVTGLLMFSFVASHFSWWNSDKPATPTCAEGKVVDVLKFPVRGAEVVCGGASSTAITYTDENGMYECPVLAGDTVIFTGTTVIASRDWAEHSASIFIDCPSGDHFCEVDASGMDGACYPVPDIEIPVCREAGIVMADNLEILTGDDTLIDLDGLRAWFWEPPGDPAECDDPWEDVPMEDCSTVTPSDYPLSHPDIGADGVPEDTKSVGPWFEVENNREAFQLERVMQDGRPVYVWDTQSFDDADGIMSEDDLGVTPMDLRGGDPLAASAPGDSVDGMGAIDQPDLLTLPDDLAVRMSSDLEIVRGGSVALTADAGHHPDGLKAFVMTDKDSPALMCRFNDDGGFSLPASATSALLETDSAGLAIFRTEVGWVAGPDGLPIRIQAFSGTATQVTVK